jgi:Protein of unknown function (DUF1553)/Protein of unknown function (DUF1549)/Planctomycete cytochrome C
MLLKMRQNVFLILLACGFFSIHAQQAAQATDVGQADGSLKFNRDIRPILSKNCFACHGFDEKARQADLRLDVADSALATRDGNIAISPRDLEKSEAWQRIVSSDPSTKMPPQSAHSELTEQEIEKLRQWILNGAEYEAHWSFIPPVAPPVPPSAQATNPIDAFINKRLSEEKLFANERANPSTLLRRLHLDLTGLPPTVAELQSFLVDPSPAAYEQRVEALLMSPHYGEQMAMSWLDAARYADTNGFSIDGGRHMWLWRDWVIQAFNDNMPYDQFLVEQLAGDLLPNRTESQLIATGFQRNNMVTHEGGTIPEENLTNYNADRIKTLGESVLGMTLACAQCHDHKFDPLTQKDYYQLFAYFNTLEDKGLDGNAGVNPGPYISAKTVLRTDELDTLKQQTSELERKLTARDDNILNRWIAEQQRREAARGNEFSQHSVKVLKISTPNRGAGFDVSGESGVKIRNAGDLGAFDILVALPKLDRPITGVRIQAVPQAEYPGGGWGAGNVKKPRAKAKDPKNDSSEAATVEKGTFRLTAISITLDSVPGDQVNLHRLEKISKVTASSWDNQFPPQQCLDPRNETGWSPDIETDGPVHLTATLNTPASSADIPYMTIQVNFGAGKNLIPGQLELSVICGADNDSELPSSILELIGSVEGERSAEQREELWNYCAKHCEELEATRIDLQNLNERIATLTQPHPTMVMNVSGKPRETFILRRGDYSQPADKVEAGTPQALSLKLEDLPNNRLGLAKWIVDRRNPLTARVAVNRLWQTFFGIGIVSTPADFGSQGQWPSHPELLDWLSVELMDHGWDLQHVIRLIVNSQAYQRSSNSAAEPLASGGSRGSVSDPTLVRGANHDNSTDPQNRLLARGPRFRLSAESVRDVALHVSGLFVDRIGGPSVNPYTPGDLWREVSHYGSTPATAQTFVQDHGEKLYRRSMYTYWKRTAPPPNMMAFDASNREVCTVTRAGTTTPLQALVTLNDVQFVECARAFAQRIMLHDSDRDARIRFAFQACLSRLPSDKELTIVQGALSKELKRYSENIEAAKQCLSAGESPRNVQLDLAEHAAWTQVASMLLNLSETITRN